MSSVYKVHWKPASTYTSKHSHTIKYGQRKHDLGVYHTILIFQICRQPKQKKPPHAVGQEFTYCKCPGLFICKQFKPGYFGLVNYPFTDDVWFFDLTITNISQFLRR